VKGDGNDDDAPLEVSPLHSFQPKYVADGNHDRFIFVDEVYVVARAAATIAPMFSGEKNSAGEIVPAFTCTKPSVAF
jgi:hypothetical protein